MWFRNFFEKPGLGIMQQNKEYQPVGSRFAAGFDESGIALSNEQSFLTTHNVVAL